MSDASLDGGRRWRWALALVWSVAFVYLLVVINPTDSPFMALAGGWSSLLGLPQGSFFKVGHVTGYVLWVVLWCAVLCGGYRKPLPERSLPWLAVGLVLLAAIPEALQGLNPARHPSWLDVGYNAIGALIGLGLRQLLVRRNAPADPAA